MIDRYFDKTYLINLDRRPDRLMRAQARCGDVGISFERIAATDGSLIERNVGAAKSDIEEIYWNKGALGLVLTFREIIFTCINSGFRSVLILEDDVCFHSDFVQLAEQLLSGIPEDWEVIYFGALHIDPIEAISGDICRIKKSYHTHCWAISERAFQLCLDVTRGLDDPLDVAIANELHPRGRSYCFSQNIAYQEGDYSDIIGTYAIEKR